MYKAGHSVLVCGHTPRDSIELRPDGADPIVVPGPVHTDPSQVTGPVDLLILAVKATQNDDAAGWLPRSTPISRRIATAERSSIDNLCSGCSGCCGPTWPSCSGSRHRWGREDSSQQPAPGGGLNGVTAAASPFDRCFAGGLAGEKPLRSASRNRAQTRQLNGKKRRGNLITS
ncbi:2-dehydropantoate 2-reductase N-terminal domain-containing protein, partial [Mycobacterium sp.]|uniref:2-dehydropantoate 2-reductase N-terminal domain-containing protein n=1 Tax=Mycobacterium sp. TaxID=1785 RepID=UPI003F972A65